MGRDKNKKNKIPHIAIYGSLACSLLAVMAASMALTLTKQPDITVKPLPESSIEENVVVFSKNTLRLDISDPQPEESSSQEASSSAESTATAQKSLSTVSSSSVPSSSVAPSSSTAPSSSVAPSSSSEASSTSQPASSTSSSAVEQETVYEIAEQEYVYNGEDDHLGVDEFEYIYNGEDDFIEDEEEKTVTNNIISTSTSNSANTTIKRYDSVSNANHNAEDEILYCSVNGVLVKDDAYTLISQIVQNETGGTLAYEAIKAHVVASYTMLKYHNARGTAPSVILKSSVSSIVKKAVDETLGIGAFYNDSYINAVYHSTSAGTTTSAQAVWGGAISYLTPVSSTYDLKAPRYASSYTISSDNFASKVKSVYGISLSGNPANWIKVYKDSAGGYIGTVEIGGYTKAQGGSYGAKAITGRSVRESLLNFSLRSHCFDVAYNSSKDQFEFTTYGYGHGVGMSQYGAHYMALDGYNFVEILKHYYTGITVE